MIDNVAFNITVYWSQRIRLDKKVSHRIFHVMFGQIHRIIIKRSMIWLFLILRNNSLINILSFSKVVQLFQHCPNVKTTVCMSAILLSPYGTRCLPARHRWATGSHDFLSGSHLADGNHCSACMTASKSSPFSSVPQCSTLPAILTDI